MPIATSRERSRARTYRRVQRCTLSVALTLGLAALQAGCAPSNPTRAPGSATTAPLWAIEVADRSSHGGKLLPQSDGLVCFADGGGPFAGRFAQATTTRALGALRDGAIPLTEADWGEALYVPDGKRGCLAPSAGIRVTLARTGQPPRTAMAVVSATQTRSAELSSSMQAYSDSIKDLARLEAEPVDQNLCRAATLIRHVGVDRWALRRAARSASHRYRSHP